MKLNRYERRRWFTDRKALPGWVVQWRYGRTSGGAFVLGGLRIGPAFGHSDRRAMSSASWTPSVPGAGITNRLLRSLILTEIQHTTAWQRGMRALLREAERLETPARDRVKAGRPMSRPIAWYQKVAATYRATPPGKKAALAKQFGVSESAMRSIIHRCRQMGLLARTNGR